MRWLLTCLAIFSATSFGDGLRDKIDQILTAHLAPALENQPALLPPSEMAAVLALLKESKKLPFQLVELKEIAGLRLEDRSGNPARLSDDGMRMLDSRGEPCDARVVRAVGSLQWIVQLDLRFWRDYLSTTEPVSVAACRLLFHEVIRLAWHRNLIATSDERSVVSNQLQLKVTDFAGAGYSVAHIAPIGEGNEFEGEMMCEDSKFGPERGFSFLSNIDLRSCRVRLVLGRNGRAKYESKVSADSTVYLSAEGYYQIDGETLVFTHDEERKEFRIGINHDHLFQSGESLFRVDRGAPAVLGKTYGAEMFCRAADIALSPRWSFWEPIHPGFGFFDKICTLEIKIGAAGDYVATISGEKNPIVVKGKTLQIGHNLILKPEKEERGAQGAYFWIARGRNGSELVSTWGEFLFENRQPQRQALFNLAKEYAGEGNCGFFPGMEKAEQKQCDYRLKVDSPLEGLVEIEITSKESGEKHVEQGVALRSSSIYALWFYEKIKRSWNFRILKDRLEDGFGNRLLPVQEPLPAS